VADLFLKRARPCAGPSPECRYLLRAPETRRLKLIEEHTATNPLSQLALPAHMTLYSPTPVFSSTSNLTTRPLTSNMLSTTLPSVPMENSVVAAGFVRLLHPP
jgi:hypothetical protein